METLGTVIIALLVFGFLIFIHEFGHYITARIFKVTINEFSIGMGPRLFHIDSKKTGIKYSISALPIGGFVAMAGEDGATEENGAIDDPNSFDKKPAYQRFIITFAGAFINIVAGFIAMIILTSIINVGDTTVRGFYDTEKTGYEVTSQQSGLMIGDHIVEVEGKKVVIYDQLSYEIMRRGYEPLDLTVIRGGNRIVIENVVFPTVEEDGITFGVMDFAIHVVEDKGIGTTLSFAFRKSVLMLRMCYESLYDLLSGRYGFSAVSGPVGISGAIGEAARDGTPALLYIVALISINLGVMNLLPIPALDGGRIFVILIEMITRRRMPAKIEGIINGVGLALLLGLSFVILIKDVIQLVL